MYQQQQPSSARSSGTPLARYSSAPAGTFLSSLVDSVVVGGGVGDAEFGGNRRLFPSSGATGESTCLTSESSCRGPDLGRSSSYGGGGGGGGSGGGGGISLGGMAGGAYDVSSGGASSSSTQQLFRQRSSPAGFLAVDNGFPITRGTGLGFTHTGPDAINFLGNRKLKSQLSFSSRQDSLSSISEISIPDISESTVLTGARSANEATGSPYMGSSEFHIASWDDPNSITFLAPLTKRAKDNNGDIIVSLGTIDSQLSLPKSSLDMAHLDQLLQMQQDTVACRVRAKRGCATHPRSIAERVRRTKISQKLRNLQDLVPNMDKQTNTADMLDLAVQHIKGLQSQVEKLSQEQANCSCPCKQAR